MFHRDVLLGLVLLLFSGLYWFGADDIVLSSLDAGVSAQALPKGLAYALGSLSLLLIVQAFARRRFAGSEEAPEPEQQEFDKSNHLRAFGIIVIGAFYLAVLSYTGYLVGLIILMGATALYMRRRPSLQMGLVVIGGALFFWLLFVEILGVPMPSGVFWDLASHF